MPDKVYVLVYTHKHGQDIGVYSTHEKAEEAIGSQISDCLAEFEDTGEIRKEIEEALKLQQFATAGELWVGYSGESESFEILERVIA